MECWELSQVLLENQTVIISEKKVTAEFSYTIPQLPPLSTLQQQPNTYTPLHSSVHKALG